MEAQPRLFSIDPKVRRVGFFESTNSPLSPPKIPPPRHLSELECSSAGRFSHSHSHSHSSCSFSFPGAGESGFDLSPLPNPPQNSNLATSATEKRQQDLQSSSKPLKAKTTKAERRALQEAQRAAKAASKVADSGRAATGKSTKQSSQRKDGPPSASSVATDKKAGDRHLEKDRKKDAPPPRMQFDDKTRVEKAKRRSVVKQTESRDRVELFLHLPQYEHGTQLPNLESKFFHLDSVHPAVFKVIVGHASTKVKDGDVLLTYGLSCVVEMILLYAHDLGKQFHVVVVDSRPKLEGQALLRRLVAKGLSCTYTHINAVSYIMHEVTRVLLGASAVLSNGTIYSRVGTSCVAMVAHAFRVPVLICCEAYKFHERVLLDSICSNELGDPDAVARVPGRMDGNYLDNWNSEDNLRLLNLMYDATPSDYVSAIVTDYGMLPPTSVPVIVREYRREFLLM